MNKTLWIAATVVVAVTFLLFTVLTLVILPGGALTGRMALLLLLFAVIVGASAVPYLAFELKKRRQRVETIVSMLSTGDLAAGLEARFSGVLKEIPGFRNLLRSFRNLIGYLQDVSENVALASGRITAKTRRLITDAGDQAHSTNTARESIHQLDEEIEKVVMSVDALSGNTEQTGTATLQMQSSIEEVVASTHTLAEFADENAAAIEEMTKSIEEVAGHADSLATFAIQNSSAMVQMDATISQIEENIKETEGVSNQVSKASEKGIEVVKEIFEDSVFSFAGSGWPTATRKSGMARPTRAARRRSSFRHPSWSMSTGWSE